MTLSVVGEAVEVMAVLGDVTLQTMGGRASIVLTHDLPLSMAAALPGRPVDSLLEHPVLDGRGYVVESVDSGPHWGGDVVTFRVGRLPLEMPWSETG